MPVDVRSSGHSNPAPQRATSPAAPSAAALSAAEALSPTEARGNVVVRAEAPTTTPIETGEPVLEAPATSAGGLPAVISSTRNI
jgi:hypothetical protein